MLKMYTKDNKWIVVDGARSIEFDNATDAWVYVFLMRDVRPNVAKATETIYPVKTLNPFPCMKRKKVIFALG